MNEDKFNEIATKHNSDKVKQHKYHKIFPQYLKELCDKSGSMLELSLPGCIERHTNMWVEMFPLMHVYMLGSTCDTQATERSTTIQCNQGNAEELQRVASYIQGKKQPLHFVSDDGCHNPRQQLLAFNVFFPLLEVGGVYIIEDIEVSYWKNGTHHGAPSRYGCGCSESTIEIFKRAIDGINYEFSQTRETAPGLCDRIVQHQQEIHSITFARNCIIIQKKEFEEDREYRFAQKLEEQVVGREYYDLGGPTYNT